MYENALSFSVTWHTNSFEILIFYVYNKHCFYCCFLVIVEQSMLVSYTIGPNVPGTLLLRIKIAGIPMFVFGI